MRNSINPTMRVYESIREKILNGEYSPSESLREQDLSVQHDVSRNTIKKSLLLLESEGLVTIELNKGTKVRAYSLEEVLEYLELRACLEGFIIRKAVPAFTDEKIGKLEEILSSMKDFHDSSQLIKYSQQNSAFHGIIYDTCPNRTAVDLVIKLRTQMSKYNTKTILIQGRNSKSYDEHHSILHAIKIRDAKIAEAFMIRHIKNVREVFKENHNLLL